MIRFSKKFMKCHFLILSLVIHVLVFLFFILPISSPRDEQISVQVEYRDGVGTRESEAKPFKRMKHQIQRPSVGDIDQESYPKLVVSNVGGSNGAGDTAIKGADAGVVASYPRISRVLGEVGDVLVLVVKNELEFDLAIAQSSGFSRLDESALKATQVAVRSGILTSYFGDKKEIQISFVFRLVDEKKEN